MAKAGDIFNEIPDLNYTENNLAHCPAEFQKVVEARRSVRVYTKDEIPEEIVQKCLDLALLAPTSSNLQSWEFYWVHSPLKKAKLVEACLSQPAAKTANVLIVAVAKTQTWKKHRKQMLELFDKSETEVPKSARAYYEKLVPFVYSQGYFGLFGCLKKVILNLRGITTATPREPTSHSDMRVWSVKTTALASENLMLAFSSFGYDTCPMEGFDQVRVKKILNLSSDSEVVMVISAGKRDSKGIYGPRIRFPREQFIFKV